MRLHKRALLDKIQTMLNTIIDEQSVNHWKIACAQRLLIATAHGRVVPGHMQTHSYRINKQVRTHAGERSGTAAVSEAGDIIV